MSLTESIQQMIISAIESTEITSANPTHINRVIQVNNISTPDLDSLIGAGGRSITPSQRKQQDVMEEFSQLTQREVSHLSSFARNPQNFLGGLMLGNIGSVASSAALVTAVLGLVQQILNQMMQPGGWLDRRFKLLVDERVQLLMANQERAEIALGYKTIRTTAYPSPRGGYGVTGSNLHQIKTNPMHVYQDTEERGLFTRLS